ncbi:hypothetical protein PC113_g18934 [Phytophthora cactorum]|uniref:Secreted protein n=1 Tax=Phytophthora cactorum TaxID=29920 RepID=A0A8T1BU45_9STRA|nr:hypothetical protein PC113_g18934 [Phytophthora cactorum]KAG2906618.1 hypothetical protein PC117_g20446 [Phytophthora cactorum]KAG3044027.1 hypothetical protein PC121_g22173 [Phytophthora cactorum]
MEKRGRPPKFIFKHAVLACLLHFCMAAVESKTLCELFGVPPATLSHVANRPTSESSSCQPVVLYHFNVCDRFMLLFASKMCQSQICCLCGFWKGSTDAVSSNFRYFFQS